MRRRLLRVISSIAAGSFVGGCALLTPLPESATTAQRLDVFPVSGLDLQRPVTAHWDQYQIPFIETETDDDLAYTLGLVHAHLRLGQMETLRRISQGRLSEMAGPLAIDIDHALRALGLGKAVPDVLAAMPAETIRWLDRYVAGVNLYVDRAAVEDRLPHEFRLYGIEPEPWTPTDVLTIGKLASADISWLAWFRLLEERGKPGFGQLWATLQDVGVDSIPSFTADEAGQTLASILANSGKAGSNSIAIAARKSSTGGALMANDPHLGITAPNLWVVAGMKSPNFHMVGMMIPGVPFVALGRNPRVAWGGTNMRAWSSDLFAVDDVPPEIISTREERIRVRWWPDTSVTIRETEAGPIVSDAPPVPGEGDIALSWMGHQVSDELTAMLRANRARDFETFRAAFETWAVSGQNFLYADVDGNIGQVLAVRLPAREVSPIADPVRPLSDREPWAETVGPLDLPFAYNPEVGFLASANNKPADTQVPVSFFFSGDDRIQRLKDVLSDTASVSPRMLKDLQRDTYMGSAHRLARLFTERFQTGAPSDGLDKEIVSAIEEWDGRYDADSQGALAFELVTAGFADVFLIDGTRKPIELSGRFYDLLLPAVEQAPADQIDTALASGLAGARAPFKQFDTWGAMHRLVLRHPVGMVPIVGRRFEFGDLPAGGSSMTLMKSAHALTTERHATRFGSQSRHLSDMSDPDENYFLLLGGQDGWFNSENFQDHVPLWQRGEMIRVPLTPAVFAERAVRTMSLSR